MGFVEQLDTFLTPGLSILYLLSFGVALATSFYGALRYRSRFMGLIFLGLSTAFLVVIGLYAQGGMMSDRELQRLWSWSYGIRLLVNVAALFMIAEYSDRPMLKHRMLCAIALCTMLSVQGVSGVVPASFQFLMVVLAGIAVLAVGINSGRASLRAFAQLHAIAFLIVAGGHLLEPNLLGGKYGEVSTLALIVVSISLFAAAVLCCVQQMEHRNRFVLFVALLSSMCSLSAVKLVQYPFTCSCSVGCEFGACDPAVLECQAKAEFVALVNANARELCAGYVKEYQERRGWLGRVEREGAKDTTIRRD